MRHYVVIPAAGIGKRFSSTRLKQYWMLGEKPILSRVIDFFLEFSFIDKIIVAIRSDDTYWTQIASSYEQRVTTVIGGDARCHSVINALQALQSVARANDWVLVHDACRPLIKRDRVLKLIEVLKDHPVGGILGIPVQDTLKRVDEGLNVLDTVDRSTIWYAQTPQIFRYGVLYEVLRDAIGKGVLVTDEAVALERAGLKVKMVEGSVLNIKITFPEDLQLAEAILEKTHENRAGV